MPTPVDAMLGLVVLAIGLLTLVIAFSVGDQKKQWISYAISGVLVLTGFYYYVSSGVRSMQMRRRIANIQRQQQVNIDQIQKRLQETQEKKEKSKK
jgi:Uri superfamily endonuclease